ncbi:MAG: hypothetical protein KKF44_03110 [Nanoarchaeota archaeon]|nr:hypothetical protein [Nanoarchaeota archaeon]
MISTLNPHFPSSPYELACEGIRQDGYGFLDKYDEQRGGKKAFPPGFHRFTLDALIHTVHDTITSVSTDSRENTESIDELLSLLVLGVSEHEYMPMNMASVFGKTVDSNRLAKMDTESFWIYIRENLDALSKNGMLQMFIELAVISDRNIVRGEDAIISTAEQSPFLFAEYEDLFPSAEVMSLFLFYINEYMNETAGFTLHDTLRIAKANHLKLIEPKEKHNMPMHKQYYIFLKNFQKFENNVIGPLKLESRFHDNYLSTFLKGFGLDELLRTSREVSIPAENNLERAFLWKQNDISDPSSTYALDYLMSAKSEEDFIAGYVLAGLCASYANRYLSTIPKDSDKRYLAATLIKDLIIHAANTMRLERSLGHLLPYEIASNISQSMALFYYTTDLALNIMDDIKPYFGALIRQKVSKQYFQTYAMQEIPETLSFDPPAHLKHYADNIFRVVEEEERLYNDVRTQIYNEIKLGIDNGWEPNLIPSMKHMYRPHELASKYYAERIKNPEAYKNKVREELQYIFEFVPALKEIIAEKDPQIHNESWEIVYPGSGSMVKGAVIKEAMDAAFKGNHELHSLEFSEGMIKLAEKFKDPDSEYIPHHIDLDKMGPEDYEVFGEENVKPSYKPRVTFIGGNLLSNQPDDMEFLRRFMYEGHAPHVIILEIEKEKILEEYVDTGGIPKTLFERLLGIHPDYLRLQHKINKDGHYERYGIIDLAEDAPGHLPSEEKMREQGYVTLRLDQNEKVDIPLGTRIKLAQSRRHNIIDLVSNMEAEGYYTKKELLCKEYGERNHKVRIAFYKDLTNPSIQ